MARKVFYSFHYKPDISRVMIVRKRWVTQGGQMKSQVIDRAEFESVKRQGDLAVKRWISSQMNDTSVTVVLIGTETLIRPYVQYEIQKSVERGNGIIGVRINNIKDFNGYYSSAGNVMTPIMINGRSIPFSNIADAIYDYTSDDGYDNLGDWVERAARLHGK